MHFETKVESLGLGPQLWRYLSQRLPFFISIAPGKSNSISESGRNERMCSFPVVCGSNCSKRWPRKFAMMWYVLIMVGTTEQKNHELTVSWWVVMAKDRKQTLWQHDRGRRFYVHEKAVNTEDDNDVPSTRVLIRTLFPLQLLLFAIPIPLSPFPFVCLFKVSHIPSFLFLQYSSIFSIIIFSLFSHSDTDIHEWRKIIARTRRKGRCKKIHVM